MIRLKAYFFLIPSGNSTTTYSNRLFADALKKLGYDIHIIFDLKEKYNILENPDCDAIFFQKTIQCPAHTKKHIQHLKNKIKLIHIDDDFHDMKSIEKLETIKMTDLILVGTHSHKEVLKEYTDVPIEVISCMIDFENYTYVKAKDKFNKPLIISWQQACADAYVNDLLMIAEPLIRIHEKYNTRLQLYGWHMGKDYRDLRYKITEKLPFAELIEYEPFSGYLTNIVPRIVNSDIFIMPYIKDNSRLGKSGFGLKRLMYSGLPIVASDTQHHRTLIKNGINGFLADTEEQWYKYMELLTISQSLRKSFSIKSRNIIEREYSNDKVIKHFIDVINRHYYIFD